jgi:Fe-S cluster assembly protein SufB
MIPQDVQLLRDSFVDYAKHHEGLFYRWGGDDPSGYDCCIPSNEIIYTPEGGKSIFDLDVGDEVFSISKDNFLCKGKVAAVFDNGIKDCVEIRTTSRRVVFSLTHPVFLYRPYVAKKGAAWTVRNHASMRFVNAGDVVRGDWISVCKKALIDSIVPETRFGKLTTGMSRFFGYFLGDGHIDREQKHCMICTFDKSHVQYLSKIARKDFGYKNKVSSGEPFGIQFHSCDICDLVDTLGLNHPSYEKEIPGWVFGLPRHLKMAFIQGYLDADGYCHEKVRGDNRYFCNHFAASSEKLIRQLHLLLTLMGEQLSSVMVSHRTKPVIIKGKEVKNARDLYRFDWYPEGRRNGTSNLLLTNYHEALGLPQEIKVERVTAVVPVGKLQTYNLEVDDHNTFIVGGVVTHNSGLTVECLKSVGLLPRKYDYTAEMLRDKFGAFKVESPYAGCLMFLLRDDGTARHVEIVINEFQTVGASGGGSTITSVEAAMEQNAFIKRRPIQTGPDVLFIDPFQVLTV